MNFYFLIRKLPLPLLPGLAQDLDIFVEPLHIIKFYQETLRSINRKLGSKLVLAHHWSLNLPSLLKKTLYSCCHGNFSFSGPQFLKLGLVIVYTSLEKVFWEVSLERACLDVLKEVSVFCTVPWILFTKPVFFYYHSTL